MSRTRSHRVTTTDGVSLHGEVHGQGPPLVLLQGVLGDGATDWQPLVPHLEDRFTCHLPSWRGRDGSDAHPDLGFPRLVEDVLTYADSIGAPSGLVGWSAGAGLALAAAAQSDAVEGVVAVEPITPGLMEPEEQAALGAAVGRMAQFAADDRPVDGVRAFAEFVFSEDEMARAEKLGYLDATATYVPEVLQFFQAQAAYEGTTHEDPDVLAAIDAPVLVLVGADTTRYAATAARYVTDRAARARLREVPGAGHAAPLTHPAAVAGELTAFFTGPGDAPR